MALRIITDSVKNCYAALGVIHNKWRPIPGRIKDFIAIPRPNLYQSLHTSVVGAARPDLRSPDPHRGDAPHRRRRHRGALEVQGRAARARRADDQRIAWLRHLVEWQRDVQDPGEFMSTLKVDLYPEEAYTFTPRGKVIVLPRDATPDRFRLRHPLRCRQHLRRREGQRPHRAAALGAAQRRHRRDHDPARPRAQKDWLAFVKTSRARNKIKHVINASERVKAIEIGQKYLEKEARRLGVQLEQDHQGRFGARRRRVRLQQDRGPATRRSATASFRRARCCRNSRPAQVTEELGRSRGPTPAPMRGAAPGCPAPGAAKATASSRSAASTT